MSKNPNSGPEKCQKAKKTPERMCKGCGLMKPKNSLLRVVRTPEGQVLWDPKGKVPGRGVYICPEESCFLKAKKTRRLERELKTEIPDELYDSLLKSIPSKSGGESAG